MTDKNKDIVTAKKAGSQIITDDEGMKYAAPLLLHIHAMRKRGALEVDYPKFNPFANHCDLSHPILIPEALTHDEKVEIERISDEIRENIKSISRTLTQASLEDDVEFDAAAHNIIRHLEALEHPEYAHKFTGEEEVLTGNYLDSMLSEDNGTSRFEKLLNNANKQSSDVGGELKSILSHYQTLRANCLDKAMHQLLFEQARIGLNPPEALVAEDSDNQMLLSGNAVGYAVPLLRFIAGKPFDASERINSLQGIITDYLLDEPPFIKVVRDLSIPKSPQHLTAPIDILRYDCGLTFHSQEPNSPGGMRKNIIAFCDLDHGRLKPEPLDDDQKKEIAHLAKVADAMKKHANRIRSSYKPDDLGNEDSYVFRHLNMVAHDIAVIDRFVQRGKLPKTTDIQARVDPDELTDLSEISHLLDISLSLKPGRYNGKLKTEDQQQIRQDILNVFEAYDANKESLDAGIHQTLYAQAKIGLGKSKRLGCFGLAAAPFVLTKTAIGAVCHHTAYGARQLLFNENKLSKLMRRKTVVSGENLKYVAPLLELAISDIKKSDPDNPARVRFSSYATIVPGANSLQIIIKPNDTHAKEMIDKLREYSDIDEGKHEGDRIEYQLHSCDLTSPVLTPPRVNLKHAIGQFERIKRNCIKARDLITNKDDNQSIIGTLDLLEQYMDILLDPKHESVKNLDAEHLFSARTLDNYLEEPESLLANMFNNANISSPDSEQLRNALVALLTSHFSLTSVGLNGAMHHVLFKQAARGLKTDKFLYEQINQGSKTDRSDNSGSLTDLGAVAAPSKLRDLLPKRENKDR